MKALRLAVSARVMRDKRRRLDVLAHDWVELLRTWNIIPHLVPNAYPDLDELLTQWSIEAVLLPGGGPPAHPDDPAPAGGSARRDAAEASLLSYAVRHDLPVLGVGRGAEKINVHFGGRLFPGGDRHRCCVHPLRPVPGAHGAGYFRACLVNSYHRLLMRPDDLAPCLRPLAMAHDDTVEGFYHETLPIVGVLWHPERAGPPGDDLDRLLAGILRRELPWAASAPAKERG